MTLGDTLYDLGDTIGWDHCDYAREQDGSLYGITDGSVTVSLALGGDTLYWDTAVSTVYGLDPIDQGQCLASEAVDVLLSAWEQAHAIAASEAEG